MKVLARLLVFLPLIIFTASCDNKNGKECETNRDCPQAYWCDRTVWECKIINGPPECTGKCCGDDGYGGTCPDNCPYEYPCNQYSCACEPRCFSDSDCGESECCIDGICWGRFCYNQECGPDPRCGFECGPCPEGFACKELGECQPYGDGALGDPCPYGPGIHASESLCGADYTCIGDYNIGTCADVADCTLPAGYNLVCFEEKCAHSFCAASCDEEDCPVGYVRRQISGRCYCFPE